MRVRELIKELQELDQVFHEIDVYREDYESLEPVKVDKIEVRSETFIKRYWLKKVREEETKTILVLG